jgi:hypothetical protein
MVQDRDKCRALNETSGSIRGRKFFNQIRNYKILKSTRAMLHGVRLL